MTFGILAFGVLGFGVLTFGNLDFGVLDSVFWAFTHWIISLRGAKLFGPEFLHIISRGIDFYPSLSIPLAIGNSFQVSAILHPYASVTDGSGQYLLAATVGCNSSRVFARDSSELGVPLLFH